MEVTNLPVAHFDFRLIADEDSILHPILGSALRGAFGAALKDVSCTVRHGACGICLHNAACHYTSIFEPQSSKDAPRPFTFQMPVPPLNRQLSVEDSLKLRIQKGKNLDFGLTIFGSKAIQSLPYIVSAVSTLAQNGIGMPRKPFLLGAVTSGGAVVFDSNQPDKLGCGAGPVDLSELVTKRIAGLYIPDRLTIRFLTPVWLREDRKLIESPTFFHLVKFLIKRLSNVHRHFSTGPLELNSTLLLGKARDIEVIGKDIWRHDFNFYSNRRHRKEHQSGILGEMTVAGPDLNSFLPLLAAGEILHIGSKTSFGLGRYEIL